MSFYRTYRPQNFENLVGQEHVRITLKNALKEGRVHHAYLFTGPRGTGKTSTARIVAKALNCLNLQDGVACETCDLCVDINEGRLIDVLEIDAASNRGIDEMRDLREKIHFAPTRAKNKVYIIDEVHMLTKEAFNALLKTLEEPPSHVFFILATTEIHKVPETIISRCQRFDFKRIDEITMVKRLRFVADTEGIEIEGSSLELIADQAQGGLRDAIGLLEQLTVEKKLSLNHVQQVLGLQSLESMERLLNFIMDGSSAQALKEISAMYESGYDLQQYTKGFLEFLRKQMLKNVCDNKPALTSRFLQYLEYFQTAYEQGRMATIPQLPLEVAIVKSCLLKDGLPQVVIIPQASAPEKVKEKVFVPEKKIEIEKDVSPLLRKDSPDTQDSQDSSPLELSHIKAHWPQVLERIHSPIVKKSILGAQLLKTEGNVLTLGFGSSFHLEKVMITQHRNELEKALTELLGEAVKLTGEVVTNSKKPFEAKDEPKIVASQSNDLASTVADIFEGEVL